MKTNKFNSSNSLLAVAVILLVGGIGIGTYYGINETNEINYLKNKSNTILTALNDTEFSKSLSLENDSFKIKDLDTFTSDLYRVFKDTPFIHTFNEPKEIQREFSLLGKQSLLCFRPFQLTQVFIGTLYFQMDNEREGEKKGDIYFSNWIMQFLRLRHPAIYHL